MFSMSTFMHKFKMSQLVCHVSVILAILKTLNAADVPEIISYSKVTRNGASMNVGSGRSYHQSYSPLRSGEILEHPQKYSTLDKEMVAKLDAKQAQDRFHPPASFEHVLAHTNARLKQDAAMSQSSMSSGYSTLPQQVYNKYNYPMDSKDLPSITNDYSSSDDSKDPSKLPSYVEFPSKPTDYSESFDDYLHGHDHGYAELIYDQPPEHHHDYTTTTTEPPEMNDQRLSKKPYSYYYIGKKLWYLPLYFSIYFVIYIAALVLKSIARHKINFPANLAEAAGARHFPGWSDLTTKILESIEQFTADAKN